MRVGRGGWGRCLRFGLLGAASGSKIVFRTRESLAERMFSDRIAILLASRLGMLGLSWWTSLFSLAATYLGLWPPICPQSAFQDGLPRTRKTSPEINCHYYGLCP